MAESKKLYDANGRQFYPETRAEYVASNALGEESTVKTEIATLGSRIQSAIAQFSGANTVNGALSGATVEYGIGGSKPGSVATWGETPELPTPEKPYCWAKLTLKWTAGNTTTPLEAIYISTAVAGAETQVMYTSVGLTTGDGLLGPTAYSTGVNGSSEKSNIKNEDNTDIIWYSWFPGIDGTRAKKYGYMAVRTREAGKAFSSWKVALFAMYPSVNNSSNNG